MTIDVETPIEITITYTDLDADEGDVRRRALQCPRTLARKPVPPNAAMIEPSSAATRSWAAQLLHRKCQLLTVG